MGNAGGTSPELQAAMQRRAGAPATPVGQGAPTFDPTTQPTQPSGQVPQATTQAQPTATAGQPTPVPFGPEERKIILGALAGTLKMSNNIHAGR